MEVVPKIREEWQNMNIWNDHGRMKHVPKNSAVDSLDMI